jgi:hypothetical protein
METTEYAPFYAGYIAQVPESDVLAVLEAQLADVPRAATAFAGERESFRYAPGKWSVRQLFGHLTDSERIFGYRMLRIARRDSTPLPGYDENEFVDHADFERVPLERLVEEWTLLRLSNLALARRFDDATLRQLGNANGNPISVRALLTILAGHPRHHLKVLAERYGAA